MSKEKTYIGKGKQVKDFDMVKCTIPVDEMKEHIYEYKGRKFLTFVVSKMKSPDQYGKTHTIYIEPPQEQKEDYHPGMYQEKDDSLPF